MQIDYQMIKQGQIAEKTLADDLIRQLSQLWGQLDILQITGGQKKRQKRFMSNQKGLCSKTIEMEKPESQWQKINSRESPLCIQ